jgi:hypothetical protein
VNGDGQIEARVIKFMPSQGGWTVNGKLCVKANSLEEVMLQIRIFGSEYQASITDPIVRYIWMYVRM